MLPIVKYPDPRLLKPCQPWSHGLKDLQVTLREMHAAMDAEKGIGLAANQVGIDARIFVMVDEKGRRWNFVNPEILEREGFQQIDEGCLSAPGATAQVPRAASVTVRALDHNMEPFTVVCYGRDAVCAQHEVDHLDGIFFLSKTTRQQRKAAERQLGLR